MQRHKDRAVIVTGAGNGIGRHIALAYAAEGANVLVVDVKPTEDTISLIASTSGDGKAVGMVQDIGSADGVRATISECLNQFGRLDGVIHNAAAHSGAMLPDLTDEIWERSQSVNLKPAFWYAREALPHLKSQSGAFLLNISSIRAFCGFPGGLSYDTSKAALLGATRTLAVELGTYGIRVNAICPGHIMSFGEENWKAHRNDETQTVYYACYPLGRVGKPEEIASVAVFLGSSEASFITGQAIIVDGGMSVTNPEVSAFRAVEWLKSKENA